MTNKELEKRIEDLEKQVAKLKGQNGTKLDKKGQYDFKVGDRVQFKTWEEMEKQNIHKYCIPQYDLQKVCEIYATIQEINNEGSNPYIKLKEFSIDENNEFKEHLEGYCYNPDMLKPATDEPRCKFKVGDRAIFRDSSHKKIEVTIKDIYYSDVDETFYIVIDNCSDKYMNGLRVDEQDLEPYTEPRWTFTDDEKVILRNLADEFEWVARDKDGSLFIFGEKPRKASGYWDADFDVESLIGFNHLFQSIKWADEEACEFRKYL